MTTPSNGTEQKWFSFFTIGLTSLALHASTLGRTATVMLYAAAEFMLAGLRAKAGLTEEEIAQAKAVCAEMEEAAKKS